VILSYSFVKELELARLNELSVAHEMIVKRWRENRLVLQPPPSVHVRKEGGDGIRYVFPTNRFYAGSV
jgi:hypothetical protein